MRTLGLINARGGSKGVPRKNIKELCGKPLIVYTIEAALASKSIDRLVVSTDDEEIADIARKWGADVPFMRPDHLASDTALQINAVQHALATLAENGDEFDRVVILQSTCPLRTADDIDSALELMDTTNADTVISVMLADGQHPITMYEEHDGELTPLLEASGRGVLRQEFPNIWWRNGAVYGIKTSVVMVDDTLYGSKIVGAPMPAERSVNIDSPLDWLVAEAFINHFKINDTET